MVVAAIVVIAAISEVISDHASPPPLAALRAIQGIALHCSALLDCTLEKSLKGTKGAV